MTVAQLAAAFAQRQEGRCHNAHSTGSQYILHKTVIAEWTIDESLRLSWGGYYTATTANHLNHILKAAGKSVRVSRKAAREMGTTTFYA